VPRPASGRSPGRFMADEMFVIRGVRVRQERTPDNALTRDFSCAYCCFRPHSCAKAEEQADAGAEPCQGDARVLTHYVRADSCVP
jgi:hypothetical protein